MYKLSKKVILMALLTGCLATLLLTWTNVLHVQSLDGTSILTGNLFLTLLILGSYCISVLFYEKAPKVFFFVGRFSNRCVGPYVGLSAVILTMALYVWLNIKETKE